MEDNRKETSKSLSILLPSFSWLLVLVSVFAIIFLFRGGSGPMLIWASIPFALAIILSILGLIFARGASRQWSLWSLIATIANVVILFSLSGILSGIHLS